MSVVRKILEAGSIFNIPVTRQGRPSSVPRRDPNPPYWSGAPDVRMKGSYGDWTVDIGGKKVARVHDANFTKFHPTAGGHFQDEMYLPQYIDSHGGKGYGGKRRRSLELLKKTRQVVVQKQREDDWGGNRENRWGLYPVLNEPKITDKGLEFDVGPIMGYDRSQ